MGLIKSLKLFYITSTIPNPCAFLAPNSTAYAKKTLVCNLIDLTYLSLAQL